MKLKPFVLEEWMKDKDQPVCKRNGDAVTNLTYFDEVDSDGQMLVGVTSIKGGDSKYLMRWKGDGTYNDFIVDCLYDLMLVDKDPLDEVEALVNSMMNRGVIIYDCNEGIYKSALKEILEFIKKLKDRDEKI